MNKRFLLFSDLAEFGYLKHLKIGNNGIYSLLILVVTTKTIPTHSNEN